MKLEEIADIQIGKTPSRSKAEYWGLGYDWVSIADLSSLNGEKYISSSSQQITEAAIQKSGIKIVPEDTILYSFKLSIGKIAITKKPMYTNEAIASIIIKPTMLQLVNKDFLFYSLKNKDVSSLVSEAVMGKTLNLKSLSNIELYIPDIESQIRIVGILNKVHSIINNKKLNVKLLEELSISKFVDLFSGFYLPQSIWDWVKFEDIIVDSTYGTAKPLSSERDGGDIVLRMNNISYLGRIDLSSLKRAFLPQIEKDNLLLKRGDVLFNRTNSPELVGKTAVWDKDGEYYFAGYLVRLRFDESIVNPYFVSGFLNSDYGKQLLMHKSRPSGTMANISPSLLKNQLIFLPPMSLQSEYEGVFKMILDRVEKLTISLNMSEILFDVIMNRAFINKIQSGDEISDFLSDGLKLQLLLDQISSREFETIEQYDSAKSVLFNILDVNSSKVQQYYDSRSGIVKISATNEVD